MQRSEEEQSAGFTPDFTTMRNLRTQLHTWLIGSSFQLHALKEQSDILGKRLRMKAVIHVESPFVALITFTLVWGFVEAFFIFNTLGI